MKRKSKQNCFKIESARKERTLTVIRHKAIRCKMIKNIHPLNLILHSILEFFTFSESFFFLLTYIIEEKEKIQIPT